MTPKNLLTLVEFLPEKPRVLLVHDSERLRLVLFCLKSGQELPPHTSTSEVVMQVLRGRGKFVLGEEEIPSSEGSLAACPPGVAHGLKAEEDFVVLATISPRPG